MVTSRRFIYKIVIIQSKPLVEPSYLSEGGVYPDFGPWRGRDLELWPASRPRRDASPREKRMLVCKRRSQSSLWLRWEAYSSPEIQTKLQSPNRRYIKITRERKSSSHSQGEVPRCPPPIALNFGYVLEVRPIRYTCFFIAARFHI